MQHAAAEIFHYHAGNRPLLITVPHAGTHVPKAIGQRFSPGSERLTDTDWHIPRLYAFAKELGAHLLVANYSRYVIDLNRPEDDQSLYPGRFTTGLVPLHRFDREALYQQGREPDAEEIQQRIEVYWRPYHEKIRSLLGQLTAEHGQALLLDAHSIASRVPAFFEGELPVVNLGTADGLACSPSLEAAAAEVARASGYSWVLNGRFKGGYTTRHYGCPGEGGQAIQLELAQQAYMEEGYPFAYRPERAGELQTRLLEPLLEAMLRSVV